MRRDAGLFQQRSALPVKDNVNYLFSQKLFEAWKYLPMIKILNLRVFINVSEFESRLISFHLCGGKGSIGVQLSELFSHFSLHSIYLVEF